MMQAKDKVVHETSGWISLKGKWKDTKLNDKLSHLYIRRVLTIGG